MQQRTSNEVVAFVSSHYKKCWLQRTQGDDEEPPPLLLNPADEPMNGSSSRLVALKASHAHLPQALRSSYGVRRCSVPPQETSEEQSLTALLIRLGPALKSVQNSCSVALHNAPHRVPEVKYLSGVLGDINLSLSKEGPCLLNSTTHGGSGRSDASVIWPATPAGSAPSPAGTSPSCSSSGQNPSATSRWETDTPTASHETLWGTFRKRPRKGARVGSGFATEASATEKATSVMQSGGDCGVLSVGRESGEEEPSCDGVVPSSQRATSGGGRTCAYCGTQKTPLWRNGPCGVKSLCNACGIRFKKLTKREGIQKAESVYAPKQSMFLQRASMDASAQPSRPATPAAQGRVMSGMRKRKQGSAGLLVANGDHAVPVFDKSRYHEGVKAAGYDPSAHPRKRQQKMKDGEGQQRPRMRGNMSMSPLADISGMDVAVPKVEEVLKVEEIDVDESSDMVDEEGAASALMALFCSF